MRWNGEDIVKFLLVMFATFFLGSMILFPVVYILGAASSSPINIFFHINSSSPINFAIYSTLVVASVVVIFWKLRWRGFLEFLSVSLAVGFLMGVAMPTIDYNLALNNPNRLFFIQISFLATSALSLFLVFVFWSRRWRGSGGNVRG